MYAIEIVFFAVALSMDAFAVAVCIGLTLQNFRIKHALIVGLYFGAFQAIMPLIGYLTGGVFAERITTFDHWVAFVLLAFLGIKMIIGSFKQDEVLEVSLGLISMLPLAFATSVDALAAGVSFAFLRVSIVPVVILIGVTTFGISVLGVKLGGVVGVKFKSKAEFAGGVVLVVLAVYSLIEGLM